MQRFINNWAATLTAPATSGDLTLSVTPAEAAKLVGLGSGDHYVLTLSEVVDDQETSWEIVKVTANAAGVLTVERGQEGTTAFAWSVGASISARATAGTLEELRDSGGGAGPELSDTLPVALGSASAGTGSKASREDHRHPLPTAAQVGAIASAEKGAASGVATLDASSKIPLAQLPATAITDTSVVASQAAMLALTAQTGDVAIRTDINTSFILRAEPASTLANWQEILAPSVGGGASVGNSVPQALGTASPGVSPSASRQDHVHAMPTAAQVGAAAIGHGHAISDTVGLPAALDAKAPLAGLPARTITASGAVAPSDAGRWIICNSATPITITISAEATASWAVAGVLPMFHVLQIGAGAVTVAGAGFSVTLHAADTNVTAGPGAAATAIRRGSDSWSLIGRLVAA